MTDSSLSAGVIDGSLRYNHGAEKYKTPTTVIEKRQRLRELGERHGVDLQKTAIKFSAAPDIAVALIVGAGSGCQIRQHWNSLLAKIPNEFWQKLKESSLVHREAVNPRSN